jgi:hypothetical protein
MAAVGIRLTTPPSAVRVPANGRFDSPVEDSRYVLIASDIQPASFFCFQYGASPLIAVQKMLMDGWLQGFHRRLKVVVRYANYARRECALVMASAFVQRSREESRFVYMESLEQERAG